MQEDSIIVTVISEHMYTHIHTTQRQGSMLQYDNIRQKINGINSNK